MQYDFLDTDCVGRLTLVGEGEGLHHIVFPNERRPITIDPTWRRDPSGFDSVRTQLQEYFDGRRKRFQLKLVPKGSAFQQKVWRMLQQIPYGTVVSYQWVASRIGNPKAVRAVGGANARNPLPIVIPCHRVIGSNGNLIGFGGGLAVKARLIALEKRFSAP